MAASSQTKITKDPVMESMLQDVAEETIRLALKMAELMEGKSDEDRQAVLKSFTDLSPDKTNMQGNSTGMQSEKENVLSSSPDKHEEESSDQFFSCDDNQKMQNTTDPSKSTATYIDVDHSDHFTTNSVTTSMESSEVRNIDSKPKPNEQKEEAHFDKMEALENGFKPAVYRVESSEDEQPPSTPASGRPSSGSELSESPPENQMNLTKQFSTSNDLTESKKGLTRDKRIIQDNSPSVTVNPESHHAKYKIVSSSLTNSHQTKFTNPEFQKPCLNKGTPVFGLPKAPGLSGIKPATSGASLGTQDHRLPSFSSGKKEPSTILVSHGPKPFQDGALDGTPSNNKPRDKGKAGESSTTTSSVTPLRNASPLSSTHEILTSSHLNLPSFPSIPLYYQPHVVIQDNLPVLMLRPVLAPGISHELKEAPLGAPPMLFPLTGAHSGESKIRIGTHVPSEEGYSTESDMEERVQREKHGQDSLHTSSGDSYVSGVEQKINSIQPTNPFFVSSGAASTYTFPTSSSPNYNLGYPVAKSGHQAVPNVSSNPFAPDEPQTTRTGDDLLRTDFKTIPKSMLASQVQLRGPPVSQTSSHVTSMTGPPQNQIGTSVISTMGLPLSQHFPVDTITSWDPPVSRHSDVTVPSRGPPVGHRGNTTLPSGPLVGQAIGNDIPPRERIPSESMLTVLVTKEQKPEVHESQFNFNTVPISADTSDNTLSRSNFSDVTCTVALSNTSITSEGFNTQGGTGVGTENALMAESKPTQTPKPSKTPLPGHVAPYWVPDDEVFKCSYCHLKFTLIRRKHHCRGCGKIFCSDCCSQLARLSYLQYQIGRICIICTNKIKEEIRRRKKNDRSQNRQGTRTRKANETTETSQSQPKFSNSVTSSAASQPQSIVQPSASRSQPSSNMSAPTILNPRSSTNQYTSSHPQTNGPNHTQLVYVPRNFISEIERYSDLTPDQTKDLSLVQPSSQSFSGEPAFSNGWQASESCPQNNPVQRTYPSSYSPSTAQPVKIGPNVSVAMTNPQNVSSLSQSQRSAFYMPQRQEAQTFNSQQEQTHPSPDSRQRSASFSEMKIPLRPAGRVVSWRGESFASRLLGPDRRKALARDLRDLPHGVTMQIAEDLQVVIKKIKVQKNPAILAWCCFSNGLASFNQQEIVMLFQVKPKEDIIPEEILRMYKVILDVVKLGNTFQHSNFLAFNSPFLGTSDNAAFIFTNDSLTPKLKAVGEEKRNFLYAILVKRSELEYAKHIPMRFLVRLGQETKSFPFPVINSRDRAVVYDGVDGDDVIYNTSLALNNYLKNSIPEALIPGLIVLQEDSKVVIQLPINAQLTIANFFDRLILKTDQTATIPMVSDLSTNVDQFKVYHQSIHTQEVSLRKHISLFRNPNNPSHCGIHSVTGLGFIILHLGSENSPTLQQRGRLLDDGVIIHLTNVHTNKLRQSLLDRSNCNFYLGDQDEILYFELRWIQEPIDTPNSDGRATHPHSLTQESQPEPYSGVATVDVRHSGHSSEKKKLANARVGDVLILIRQFEEGIKQACMEPLMMHSNRMKAGETKEVILRLSLRDGYKQWSIGPSNQPMGLIRSLQMALHAVKLPDLRNACLGLSFDVTIIKQ